MNFVQKYPVFVLIEDLSAFAGPEDQAVEFYPGDSSPSSILEDQEVEFYPGDLLSLPSLPDDQAVEPHLPPVFSVVS